MKISQELAFFMFRAGKSILICVDIQQEKVYLFGDFRLAKKTGLQVLTL